MNVKQLVIALLLFVLTGCYGTGGNRRPEQPLVDRVGDLKSRVGKVVTLVGTARAGDSAGATIDLRGGAVELPAYTWPKEYIDRRVTVSGMVFEPAADDPHRSKRVYRLGEVQSSAVWSR